MSRERRRGIEISEEVARAEAVPEDLDATQREPYTIPSTRRRRSAAVVYAVAALLATLAPLGGLPVGMLAAAVGFALLAGWHAMSAWRIEILDPEALERANREVGFAVGHASAAVGFDGWRARPVWNVLLFSADDPPTRRALVRIDAVDGHLVEKYDEAIAVPE